MTKFSRMDTERLVWEHDKMLEDFKLLEAFMCDKCKVFDDCKKGIEQHTFCKLNQMNINLSNISRTLMLMNETLIKINMNLKED